MKIPLSLALLLVPLVACGGGEEVPSVAETKVTATPSAIPVPAAFADAENILALREKPDSEEEVVVHGRVRDFVEGLAAFTLTDMSVEPCDASQGDSCKTPWDYCCEAPDVLAKASVTVAFHADGEIAPDTLPAFRGIDHLDHVFVRGPVTRDAVGNLTVAVASIHVAK